MTCRKPRRVSLRSIAGAILMGVIASGCLGPNQQVQPPVRPSSSPELPNPIGAVFANCRELVCTSAELPSCDFQEAFQGTDAQPIIDRMHCERSGDGTYCEQRRALGSNLGREASGEVLKFRCAGDPVECWTIGGSATWETTLNPAQEGGQPLKYPCRSGNPGRPPAEHPVPGPDTVKTEPRHSLVPQGAVVSCLNREHWLV